MSDEPLAIQILYEWKQAHVQGYREKAEQALERLRILSERPKKRERQETYKKGNTSGKEVTGGHDEFGFCQRARHGSGHSAHTRSDQVHAPESRGAECESGPDDTDPADA